MINQPAMYGLHMQNMPLPKEEPLLPPDQGSDLNNWARSPHHQHHMSPPHQPVTRPSPKIPQVSFNVKSVFYKLYQLFFLAFKCYSCGET